MKNKGITILLLIGVIFMFCGCSALFFDTYYSEKEFQGNQSIDLDSDIQMVRNYSELRRLVFNSMNDHEESMELRFVGYTGNAVSDIASVCNAVKTESAYGAYCVDYITYDMTQIVSYYEALIEISYKYTAEELSEIQTTSNHESFAEILAEELRNESPRIVVRVNNGSSENAVVTELIQQTIRENPLSISYFPDYSLKIYSGNSSQKIYEVNITYGDFDNAERLKALADRVNALAQINGAESTAKKAAAAANALRDSCIYSAVGGRTAYSALVEKQADSEGMAGAYKALCDKLQIECLVVKGKLNRAEHFWNIVKINDAYYHVDVTSLGNVTQSIFKCDEEQQVNYWWNQSDYPGCKGEPMEKTEY